MNKELPLTEFMLTDIVEDEFDLTDLKIVNDSPYNNDHSLYELASKGVLAYCPEERHKKMLERLDGFKFPPGPLLD